MNDRKLLTFGQLVCYALIIESVPSQVEASGLALYLILRRTNEIQFLIVIERDPFGYV
jgi:hypothetical protein